MHVDGGVQAEVTLERKRHQALYHKRASVTAEAQHHPQCQEVTDNRGLIKPRVAGHRLPGAIDSLLKSQVHRPVICTACTPMPSGTTWDYNLAFQGPP